MSVSAITSVDNIGPFTIKYSEYYQRWNWEYQNTTSRKAAKVYYGVFIASACIFMTIRERFFSSVFEEKMDVFKANNVEWVLRNHLRQGWGVWIDWSLAYLVFRITKFVVGRFFSYQYVNSYEGLLQAMLKEITSSPEWTARKAAMLKMVIAEGSRPITINGDFLEELLRCDAVPSSVKQDIVDFLLKQEMPSDLATLLPIRAKLRFALEQALKADIPDEKKAQIVTFIFLNNLTAPAEWYWNLMQKNQQNSPSGAYLQANTNLNERK